MHVSVLKGALVDAYIPHSPMKDRKIKNKKLIKPHSRCWEHWCIYMYTFFFRIRPFIGAIIIKAETLITVFWVLLV